MQKCGHISSAEAPGLARAGSEIATLTNILTVPLRPLRSCLTGYTSTRVRLLVGNDPAPLLVLGNLVTQPMSMVAYSVRPPRANGSMPVIVDCFTVRLTPHLYHCAYGYSSSPNSVVPFVAPAIDSAPRTGFGMKHQVPRRSIYSHIPQRAHPY